MDDDTHASRPLHARIALGETVPPDYFAPGGHGDKPALFVIAYWGGTHVDTASQYHFTRAAFGLPWVLKYVSLTLHTISVDLAKGAGRVGES